MLKERLKLANELWDRGVQVRQSIGSFCPKNIAVNFKHLIFQTCVKTAGSCPLVEIVFGKFLDFLKIYIGRKHEKSSKFIVLSAKIIDVTLFGSLNWFCEQKYCKIL